MTDITGGNFNQSIIGSTIAGDVNFHAPDQAALQAKQLAEAMARLEAMPTEELPEPKPLPPHYRMVFGRNEKFTNREEALRTLAQSLKGRAETVAITPMAAATGLGGVGKSQLAVEFAFRYGQFFAGGVYWLNFDNEATALDAIADCSGVIPEAQRAAFLELPPPKRIEWVRQAWQEAMPRLLIFDNCEEPELLHRYRPLSGGCRLLVTSRYHQWQVHEVNSLALAVFEPAKSITLLRKFRPDLAADDPNLAAIAAELGHLPLALHLAGSYLAECRQESFGQPAVYLQELQAEALGHETLQGVEAGYSPTQHDRNVGRTFDLSYQRLQPSQPIDRLAQQLLARAAHFAPGEAIPRPLLYATLTAAAEQPPLTDKQKFRALTRLVNLGLLQATDSAEVTIHRLVAQFALRQAADPTAQAEVEQTLLIQASRLNEQGDPRPLQAWQSHLRAVTEAALPRHDEQAADLANELGFHLHASGDYRAAWPYWEQALAIRQEVLGAKHPNTARSLNNLGMLLRAMGEYAAARPYYERALAIFEEVLGAKHPNTALSLNNLGMLLQAMGDYGAARAYYERALAIRQEVLGAKHPDMANSLNNLGHLLKIQGDYAAARPYYERALAIWEEVLGAKHPDTANSLNNLGMLLQAMGDYAAVRPYYERALAIFEEVLGAKHPNTALSLNNLGVLLKIQGEYAAVRPYYERALAIRQEVLGVKHPDTAQSLNNLGMLLQAMGNYAVAQPYFERALAIWEEVLGAKHPDTASSLNNLGYLLEARGDYTAARPYYERAFAIRAEVLGVKHPDTAQSLNNLAVLSYYEGDMAQAAGLMRRALSIWEASLGTGHPDIVKARGNLAVIEGRLGGSTAGGRTGLPE